MYTATVVGPRDLQVRGKLSVLTGAQAAIKLAEFALLRDGLPPGNLQVPEPVYRDDTLPAGAAITLTVDNTDKPPPTLLRGKAITILPKPPRRR